MNQSTCLTILSRKFFSACGFIMKRKEIFIIKFDKLNELSREYTKENFEEYIDNEYNDEDIIDNSIILDINKNDLQIFYGIITTLIFNEEKKLEDIQKIETNDINNIIKSIKLYEKNNNLYDEIILNFIMLNVMKEEKMLEKEDIITILFLFSNIYDIINIPPMIYHSNLYLIEFSIIKEVYPDVLTDGDGYKVKHYNNYQYYLTQKATIDYNKILTILIKEIILLITTECNIEEIVSYNKIFYESIVENEVEKSVNKLLYFPKFGRLYDKANNKF